MKLLLLTSECVCCDLQLGDINKNRTKGGWQQKSKGPKKTAKSKKKKPVKKKPTPVPLPQSKQQKQKQANGVIGSVSLLFLLYSYLYRDVMCTKMFKPYVHSI